MNPPVPCIPTSAHWLGDRQAADETRHASDRRGVVLYFNNEEACTDFLAWLTQVSVLARPTPTDAEKLRRIAEAVAECEHYCALNNGGSECNCGGWWFRRPEMTAALTGPGFSQREQTP